MALRDWGRAWDVLYWSGVVLLLLAGLVLPPRVGVAPLGLAAFLVVLAPFRGRPTTFWPILFGYVGFAVGFTIVGLTVDQPVVPGLLVGIGAGGVAAVAARAITRKQERLAEERRGRRP